MWRLTGWGMKDKLSLFAARGIHASRFGVGDVRMQGMGLAPRRRRWWLRRLEIWGIGPPVPEEMPMSFQVSPSSKDVLERLSKVQLRLVARSSAGEDFWRRGIFLVQRVERVSCWSCLGWMSFATILSTGWERT